MANEPLILLRDADNANDSLVNMVNGLEMVTNGTGLNGTGTVIRGSIYRRQGLIYTDIYVDLTGLRSTAAGDIIGINGTALPCYLTKIEYANSGTIVAGAIACYEAPVGGDPDIDLYSATAATGVEDTAISTLVETQLVDSGDHTLGSVKFMTAFPADGEYLYLVAGSTTDADYTAGKLIIQFIGIGDILPHEVN